MQDAIRQIVRTNINKKVSTEVLDTLEQELTHLLSKVVLEELRDLTDLADPYMRAEAEKRITQIENYLDPLGRVIKYRDVQ